MPLLRWLPEYSVNEAGLDNDHRKLFDILNTVYENIMNSKEVDYVLQFIDELSDYTRYHLSAEEQHMREIGFPEIDAHVAEHRDFTIKIEALRTQFNGNNLEVAQGLIVLLGDWLLRHVLKEDRKYSTLTKAIGA